MIASMREALGNVARHANATSVDLAIAVDGDHVVLTVSDDGVGPPVTDGPMAGNGLVNLEARAKLLGGRCSLMPGPVGGAVLTWTVPY
jgi:signal transduction histidine kinase